MQERRNSTANALELRLSCTNPSICVNELCLTDGFFPNSTKSLYRPVLIYQKWDLIEQYFMDILSIQLFSTRCFFIVYPAVSFTSCSEKWPGGTLKTEQNSRCFEDNIDQMHFLNGNYSIGLKSVIAQLTISPNQFRSWLGADNYQMLFLIENYFIGIKISLKCHCINDIKSSSVQVMAWCQNRWPALTWTK